MSIRVVCPAYGKGIQAPEKYAGRSAKCPGCGEAIQVPPPSVAAFVATEVATEPAPAGRDCPFCAETIKLAATKCRFCGEFLDGRKGPSPAPEPVLVRTTGSDRGLPTSQSEATLIKCRPVMFRNRPGKFFLLLFLAIACASVASSTESSEVAMGFWGASGIFILMFAIWYLEVITTRVTVTTKRTILRNGILSKRTREVRHSDVRLLEVNQGMFARLFGVGDLSVASAGHGEVEIFIAGIRRPGHVKETIDGYRT